MITRHNVLEDVYLCDCGAELAYDPGDAMFDGLCPYCSDDGYDETYEYEIDEQLGDERWGTA